MKEIYTIKNFPDKTAKIINTHLENDAKAEYDNKNSSRKSSDFGVKKIYQTRIDTRLERSYQEKVK